jgi:hypothetical protein
MRRVHLVTALILLGLGALVAWVAMNTYWKTDTIPGVMRGEARTNPDYAAGRLAQRLGARLSVLPDLLAPLPPAGQVLFLTGTNLDVPPERRQALEEWVMHGGHLVIDGSDVIDDAELARWAGVTQSRIEPRRGKPAEAGDDDDDESAQQATLPELLQRRSCASYPQRADHDDAGAYLLCNFATRTRLHSTRRPDFALGDADGLQAVRVPLGSGSLSVLNGVRPFDNRDLLRGDHGLLFATLALVRPGATIWTLNGGSGPGLMGFIWNRAAGVVLLCAAALGAALWRAAVRFGPVRAPATATRRSLRAQIAGQARFLQARGGEAVLLQAALRAFEAALALRLPGHQRLAPEERLAAIAGLTGLPQAELQAAVLGAPARAHTDLVRRLGVLEHARRRLLDQGRENQDP